MHHVMVGIGLQRLRRALGCELARGIALPVDLLPPDFCDLNTAVPFGNRAECSACLNRLQLLRIANQNYLRPGLVRVREHPLHLARANHPRLVDDKHVARCQQLAALPPLMFKAGNGARRYR